VCECVSFLWEFISFMVLCSHTIPHLRKHTHTHTQKTNNTHTLTLTHLRATWSTVDKIILSANITWWKKKRVMADVWMSHGIHARLTFEWFWFLAPTSHGGKKQRVTTDVRMRHAHVRHSFTCATCLRWRHGTPMYESWHTHVWVMAHPCMSHGMPPRTNKEV